MLILNSVRVVGTAAGLAFLLPIMTALKLHALRRGRPEQEQLDGTLPSDQPLSRDGVLFFHLLHGQL